MNLKIEIKKEDLGFRYKQIKSLLGKFADLNLAQKPDEIVIRLDFKEGEVSELNMTIIWRLLLEFKGKVNKISIRYNDKSALYFQERHFFESLRGEKSSLWTPSIPINFETFISMRPTAEASQNEEMNSIFEKSTKKILDPKKDFHMELSTHMTECIQNTFDHSQASAQKPSGILCTVKKNKFIDFCIVDMGQGIKSSFMSNPGLRKDYEKLSEAEVILKAVQKRVSCNPEEIKNPNYQRNNGGIGLYYLNEFIQKHNDSMLIIISGSGYYYTEYRGKIKSHILDTPWQGTVVYFRTKLRQHKSESYAALNEEFKIEFDNSVSNVV